MIRVIVCYSGGRLLTIGIAMTGISIVRLDSPAWAVKETMNEGANRVILTRASQLW